MRMKFLVLFWLYKLSLVQSERSFDAQKCLSFSKNVLNCEHSQEELVVSSGFAKEREFPHACLIGYEKSKDDFYFACGGSLISERFVLSTAQCAFINDLGKAKFVKIGNAVRGLPNSDTYTYEITHRIKHPMYTKKSLFYNDIALFKLDRDVEFNDFVRPICLPIRDNNLDKAVFSGWGTLGFGQDLSSKMKKITMEIFTQEECQNVYHNDTNLLNGIDYKIMVCFGSHTTEGIDSCRGDAGSPIQVLNPDNCMYTIIGVASYGIAKCGSIGSPGIYVRVYPYMDWIKSVIDPDFEIAKSFCPAEEIVGHNIESRCENQNDLLICEGNLDIDTEVKINCKLGYNNFERKRNLITECTNYGWSEPTIKCSPNCGIMNKKISNELIVGGEKVKNTEFPWNVAIYRKKKVRKNPIGVDEFICGGSIISDKVVISAAHCFFRELTNGNVRLEKLERYKVAAGKYFSDLNATEALPVQIFNVFDVRGVDGYNGYEGLYTADIALVILAERVQFKPHISPVCLDYDHRLGLKSRSPVGQLGSFCGFGWTEFDGTTEHSLELKSLDVPVVSYQECKNSSDDFSKFITSGMFFYNCFIIIVTCQIFYLIEDKFCAGKNDGQASCRGDSGGGLVFPKEVGGTTAYYLRGLVSNSRTYVIGGVIACDVGFYTLFTNIHVYISVIEEVVKEFATN